MICCYIILLVIGVIAGIFIRWVYERYIHNSSYTTTTAPILTPREKDKIVEESLQNTNQAFKKIYDEGVWGQDENGKGTSGYGSNPQFNQKYIQFMRKFIIDNDIKSIVDIGCGDWQFSHEIYHDLDVNYHGYDCVKHLIEKHKKSYSNIKKYNFHHINGDNVFKSIKNNRNADLLIMKDVIQHWTYDNILNFFENLNKKTNFKHFILINDHTCDESFDIKVGEYRRLNLDTKPLNILRNEFQFENVFDFKTADGKTAYLVSKHK